MADLLAPVRCDGCGKSVARADVVIECPRCLQRPGCVNCQTGLLESYLFIDRGATVGPFCRPCRDVIAFGASQQA